VPALAIAEAPGETASAIAEPDGAGGFRLSSARLTAVVDGRGLLVSLVDAATGREAIAPDAAGNLLQLHRDVPNRWDAWDIDEFYRRTIVPETGAAEVTLETTGDGPVVVVRRVLGSSPVTQRLSLAANAPALHLHTSVDWRERQKLLKLGFGFDLRADTSAAETHFGHVRRPTHTNTSWDQARFEFCAHRWLLVDEPGYGVSIANDATYGHEVTRAVREDGGTTTTVRLSLLRAPVYPDPEADQGVHEFVVTVRPDSDAARAVEQGYHTNLSLRRFTGGAAVAPLFTVSEPGLVIEAVKLAEDGSGDVVVRLYEAHGRRTSGRLVPGFAAAPAVITDIMERPVPSPAGVAVDDGGVDLTLRPFQLVTLRFGRQG
jgi:alpha-mannosidase